MLFCQYITKLCQYIARIMPMWYKIYMFGKLDHCHMAKQIYKHCQIKNWKYELTAKPLILVKWTSVWNRYWINWVALEFGALPVYKNQFYKYYTQEWLEDCVWWTKWIRPMLNSRNL